MAANHQLSLIASTFYEFLLSMEITYLAPEDERRQNTSSEYVLQTSRKDKGPLVWFWGHATGQKYNSGALSGKSPTPRVKKLSKYYVVLLLFLSTVPGVTLG